MRSRWRARATGAPAAAGIAAAASATAATAQAAIHARMGEAVRRAPAPGASAKRVATRGRREQRGRGDDRADQRAAETPAPVAVARWRRV